MLFLIVSVVKDFTTYFLRFGQDELLGSDEDVGSF